MKETKNFHSNGKRLLSPKTDIVFEKLEVKKLQKNF